MFSTYRTSAVIAVLSILAVSRADEPPAWPAFDWNKAAPSPFARVESPTSVVDGAAIIAGRIVVTGGGLNNPRPLTANTWIATLPNR